MDKDKIVILGGNGMLGTDLAIACRKSHFDARVFDLPDFDITDEQQLSRALTDAAAVVNCAACTNVEKAESEIELAYKVNAEAVGRLGHLARQAGIWVLHISTDFVFDGTLARPYVESDATNPINTYGRSKLAGERLLIESGCRHCTMRLEWTYGLNGNNFIKKLVSLARQGSKLRVVDDQVGSPTATAEIARVICELLDSKPEGVFHFAGAGYVSRFEIAKFIFDSLDMPVDLKSCKSSDYSSAAARPLNSRFDCSKIKPLLNEPIKTWQEMLKYFLEQL